MRITWTKGPYSSYRGRCGRIELFGIHYRTRSGDPAYFLTTELPQMQVDRKRSKDDNPDALREYAEQVLDAWLTEIGAFA